MKAFIAMILLAGSIQASATVTLPLVCTEGVIGTEEYTRVELLKGEVSYQKHELHFKLSAADTNISGNALAIVDKTVKVQVEGDEQELKVSGLFVYNSKTQILSSTVVYDNSTQNVFTKALKCK